MPVNNRVAAMAEEITVWRRDFHENPELLYDVHRTAGIVAEKLKAFGCDEVVTGVGQTGVVAVIKGRKQSSGRVIGLRADMDALPIEEETGVPYSSKVKGKMHACGHDGHTATLLGAAKYLAETRNFDGTAIMIFQPAEEGGAGGKAMVDDGMMDRFGVQEVYGMHNAPGLPIGTFATRPGPLLAASDRIFIKVKGRGGHGAKPHLAVDPVLIGSHIVIALQSIASRNIDPLDNCVISMTMFHGGTATNVIPETVELQGTVRSLKPQVRETLEKRIVEIAEGTAKMMGGVAEVVYEHGYPCTVNHERETAFAAEVARSVVGDKGVIADMTPVMGGEDFSYMLESRPGAFIFYGNGDSGPLHHPSYNFNDESIPYVVSLFAKLAETAMPAK